LFGHKVNLTTGKSNLIIDCEIPRGNASDTSLFKPAIERTLLNFDKTPRYIVTDGEYASKENSEYCKSKGFVNIVFNKVIGSLQNIATSSNMVTRLKKVA
jgi:IS5 family transposase